jgi:hypothetical protein
LIFLALSLYGLFKGVNQYLAVLMVILGGVLPAAIDFVNVVNDAAVLVIIRGADFLSVFDKPQRDALAMLLLRLHDHQFTATLLLAGIWLFPLAILVCKSRFMPRFLGVWLFIAGIGWSIMCLTGFLSPQYQDKEFMIFQPAFFGEIVFMLWLIIKGAKAAALEAAASSGPPRMK